MPIKLIAERWKWQSFYFDYRLAL